MLQHQKCHKYCHLHPIKIQNLFILCIQIQNSISQQMQRKKQNVLLPESSLFFFILQIYQPESLQCVQCQHQNHGIFGKFCDYIYHTYSTPRLKWPLVNSPFQEVPVIHRSSNSLVSFPFSVVNIMRQAPVPSASTSAFLSRRYNGWLL